jgi:hypothetical protein
MPYIDTKSREKIFTKEKADTVGELNYFFTKIIDQYLVDKGLNYQHINDVIGALECCKMELYRRIAVPYEDEKRTENGDVYSINKR